MIIKATSKTIDLGDGIPVTIETGKLARQADGAVTITVGDMVLLCTVVSNKEPRATASFFPLSVDYQEKFASAGRIPGGFLKREGRLSDHEILVCRLVDRALRPLFPDGYMNDTQILIYLISNDPEIMPDCYAALAASAALTLSDINFDGPISEVRVARINNEFVVNPKVEALAKADIDILVGATFDNVTMVEGEMAEVSEQELIDAIKVGHEAIKVQCTAQIEIAKELGYFDNKRALAVKEERPDVKEKVQQLASDKIYQVAKGAFSKAERKEQLGAIKDEVKENFTEEELQEVGEFISKYYKDLEKNVIRNMMIDDQVRLDGRKFDEVRPLYMETDLLPSPHGCALFTRGETQSLTTVTLGSKDDEKMIDKASGLIFTDLMLHYNFPPFSTGEVKPIRGVSRREVGHGNLAQRSIARVLPAEEDNPYTIRIVSDILESNGSSSMATVCASSMALMDAGIKITGGVSGIAMGLVMREDGKFAVLSDILGDEDHLGDMDFKVTGTKNGICACQMDIKVDGLPYSIMEQALIQANEGRLHILNQMNEVIAGPREDLKPHAPRVHKMVISLEFVGAIIGPGGKHIQELQRNTNTNISIEEINNKQASVTIAGADKSGLDEALEKIQGITASPEEGEVYKAKVKTIMPYGAFVEFMPGKEGLLHISEISWKRLETMDDIFEVGDEVKVKLVGVDQRTGKFKLSRKVLLERPPKENKE